ncbi:MAG: F0F1 ATP synthase subunit epsilon [Pseudomonadota bacterium]
MADKLTFNLVTPERQLMSEPVDHVVVPGADGYFGVLPNHAPLMSTILPGVLTVINGGAETKIFVVGGFAEVTPDGLTVLAEEATLAADLKGDALSSRITAAEKALEGAANDDERLAQNQALEQLRALASGA